MKTPAAPPLDPRPIGTSVSSDLVWSWYCCCCCLLASISFLNFCWSCCCRSFLSCLGSVCASEPSTSTAPTVGLRGRDGEKRSELIKKCQHQSKQEPDPSILPGASVLTPPVGCIRSVNFWIVLVLVEDFGIQRHPARTHRRRRLFLPVQTGEPSFLHRGLTLRALSLGRV